jgi:hypothetical protein
MDDDIGASTISDAPGDRLSTADPSGLCSAAAIQYISADRLIHRYQGGYLKLSQSIITDAADPHSSSNLPGAPPEKRNRQA